LAISALNTAIYAENNSNNIGFQEKSHFVRRKLVKMAENSFWNIG
jgi:hypothetical protein